MSTGVCRLVPTFLQCLSASYIQETARHRPTPTLPHSDRCRLKRRCLLQTRTRSSGHTGPRAAVWAGQGRQRGVPEGAKVLTRAASWEAAQARKSRPYPGNGSSSRIQAGAVTGPPYLANFRQRLCPAARASLRAMLALLLQTLASITKRWIGSVETGLRTGFRPRTSRVTFERAKRRLPTNEASRLEACPARLIASRSSRTSSSPLRLLRLVFKYVSVARPSNAYMPFRRPPCAAPLQYITPGHCMRYIALPPGPSPPHPNTARHMLPCQISYVHVAHHPTASKARHWWPALP
jgi:hypothetical protein